MNQTITHSYHVEYIMFDSKSTHDIVENHIRIQFLRKDATKFKDNG